MRMRPATSTLIAAAVLMAAAPALAAPRHSWGKTGNSFEQYKIDAAECTYQGATFQAPEQPSTLETSGGVGPLASGEEVLYDFLLRQRRAEIVKQVRLFDALQAEVERCLAERGYRRFALTAAQAAQLKTLAPGSQPRKEYLYSLSVDPAVLAAQGL